MLGKTLQFVRRERKSPRDVGGAWTLLVSDEGLMVNFQRGARDALEELFARYREPLYGFFRRRLANSQGAEDLTQETFVAVIRASARYEPRARVKTYLYGIALNLLATERRRQAKQCMVEMPGEPSVTMSSDSEIWVRDALQKLGATEREILMLREYEQLSYGEIAEILRVPVNTVRSRLFRARMALKEYLEPAAQMDTAER